MKDMKESDHSVKITLQAILSISTGIFIFVLFYALYITKEITVPVVIAILFSFLINPSVNFLQRFYIPRTIGAMLVILFLVCVIGGSCYGLAQPARDWVNKGPEALNKVNEKISAVANYIEKPMKILSKVNNSISGLMQNGKNQTQNQNITVLSAGSSVILSSIATTTGSFLEEAAITIMLLYFLLLYDDFFLRKIVPWLSSMEQKKEAVIITREIQQNIFKYLFARVAINVLFGILVSIVMYLFDMPDAILWGFMTGILLFVPYVGALLGLIVIFAVAVFTFPSFSYALVVTLVYFGLIFIEANLITPYVIGRAILLNPIIVFISILFWGWLWGVAGAFIAIPLMVSIKIILSEFYEVTLMNQLFAD